MQFSFEIIAYTEHIMQILSKFYIDSVRYTNILNHLVSKDYQRWWQGDIQLRAAGVMTICNIV